MASAGCSSVYYAFDLLHLNGRDTLDLPLVERKSLLEPLIADKPGIQFNGHEVGEGELILKHAGKLGFEDVVSKTINAPYAQEIAVCGAKQNGSTAKSSSSLAGPTPEGARPHLGALLLGYSRR